jgi:hypothetical protein
MAFLGQDKYGWMFYREVKVRLAFEWSPKADPDVRNVR